MTFTYDINKDVCPLFNSLFNSKYKRVISRYLFIFLVFTVFEKDIFILEVILLMF